jgi:hypothetical protein
MEPMPAPPGWACSGASTCAAAFRTKRPRTHWLFGAFNPRGGGLAGPGQGCYGHEQGVGVVAVAGDDGLHRRVGLVLPSVLPQGLALAEQCLRDFPADGRIRVVPEPAVKILKRGQGLAFPALFPKGLGFQEQDVRSTTALARDCSALPWAWTVSSVAECSPVVPEAARASSGFPCPSKIIDFMALAATRICCIRAARPSVPAAGPRCFRGDAL